MHPRPTFSLVSVGRLHTPICEFRREYRADNQWGGSTRYWGKVVLALPFVGDHVQWTYVELSVRSPSSVPATNSRSLPLIGLHSRTLTLCSGSCRFRREIQLRPARVASLLPEADQESQRRWPRSASSVVCHGRCSPVCVCCSYSSSNTRPSFV